MLDRAADTTEGEPRGLAVVDGTGAVEGVGEEENKIGSVRGRSEAYIAPLLQRG